MRSAWPSCIVHCIRAEGSGVAMDTLDMRAHLSYACRPRALRKGPLMWCTLTPSRPPLGPSFRLHVRTPLAADNRFECRVCVSVSDPFQIYHTCRRPRGTLAVNTPTRHNMPWFSISSAVAQQLNGRQGAVAYYFIRAQSEPDWYWLCRWWCWRRDDQRGSPREPHLRSHASWRDRAGGSAAVAAPPRHPPHRLP